MKITLLLCLLTLVAPAFSQNIKAALVATENTELTALPGSRILRIEKDVSANWSGVSGCCKGGTPNKEITKSFDKWVKDMLFEHKELRFVRYGHNEAEAECSTSKGPFPDKKRSCRGSAAVKAYIEFEKL